MVDNTDITNLDQEYNFFSNTFVAFMNLPRRKRDIKNQEFGFYLEKKEIICSMYTNRYLPYGSCARLLLVWLITEIKLHNDVNINLGDSLSEFIKTLNLKKSGSAYKLILEQLNLLSSLAFSFTSTSLNDNKQYTEFNNFFIFESGKFIEDLKEKSTLGCTVKVSEQFFKLAQKSFPLSAKDFVKLISFPLAIDIYLWLAPQLFIAQKQKRNLIITWQQLNKNFLQYTINSVQSRKDFKKDFKKAIGKIVEINPNLHCTVDTKTGITILSTSKTFVALNK